MARYDNAKAAGKLEAESLFLSPYYPASYQFPYNPDSLARSNNYSIYDEMQDDDQVKVALSLKKDMVLNSGWTIVCDKEEIKDFVTENIENIGFQDSLESGFDEIMRDILSSYAYGFSLSEPIYRSPAKTLSGKWELRTVKVRPPHSFIFDIDEKGTVEKIRQFTSKATLEFDPEIFLHNVYQPEFGNPYGKSDLKAAHPAWKAKKFLFRMAMRYSERFAGALVVGRYTSTMTPQDISRLSTVLQSVQDNTTLIIPDEAKFELVQAAKDSSDIYEKLLHMLNMWIARAILIPDLMGMSGEKSGGGSYALGKEQFKVFLSSIRNDRLNLQRKITLKVIKPLVQTNFGDIPCKFEFKPIEAGDEIELLRLWVDAVNGKMFKPTEEEVNHLRGKTGFPEGPVEFASEPVQFDPEGKPIDPKNPTGNPSGTAGNPGKKQPEGGPKEAAADKEMSLKTFRSLTPYEAKIDFASMARTMDASEDSLSRHLISVTNRMARDLMDQAKGILVNFKPERVNELKPKYLKEMNDLVRGHFIRLFRIGLEHAKKEIHGKNAKNFVADDIFPDEFEDILRAESFKLVGDISKDVLKRTENVLLDGLKSGASPKELMDKMTDQIRDHAERHIQTIVRTKTTEIFNASRKTFFDTDETAKDIITGYQFSAVMDDRTSDVCARLDGKTFEKDEADYIAKTTPPLHFNCRSLLVPVTRFEEVKFDKPVSLDRLKDLGGNLIFKRIENHD